MQKLFTIAAILLGVTGAGVFHTVLAQEVQTIQFFSDLNTDSLVGQAAANLRESEVISGYPDGTFQPDKPVNRAELAKFLLLAKGRNVNIKHNNGRFPDVKEGEWYVRYIIDAADLGIISGYPSGNFKPAQTVNTAEFLKMLSKTFDLPEDLPQDFADVDSTAWFAPYVGNVPEWDLFPERGVAFLEPAREMTRGEVAVAIYRIMRPKLEELNEEVGGSGGGANTGPILISVRSANENPQLTMTYPAKTKELVLPLYVSASHGAVTIKSLQIGLSSSKFLDQMWAKGKIKKPANRVRLTIPVNEEVLDGEEYLIEVFASVKSGLIRGNSVQVFLEKIEWERGGETSTHNFSVEGFELMIF